MKWIQANSYAIQPTKENKLVVEIPALSSKPEKPVLIYDKGDHALLYRNTEEGMVLDYIHPEIREKLFQAETVAVCEFDIQKEEVLYFYDVAVQHVPNIAVQLFQSQTTKVKK